jgi:hypothetical protein
LFGLILTLVDIAYIMVHIDDTHQTVQVEQIPKQQQPQHRNEPESETLRIPSPTEQKQAPKHKRVHVDAVFIPKKLMASVHLSEQERARVISQKKPILNLLEGLGLDDVDDETLSRLPTWQDVVDLYGEKPRILGLDRCENFQNHSNKSEHFIGTAGTFNSGTNLLAELLIHNCHNPARMEAYGQQNRGIRW